MSQTQHPEASFAKVRLLHGPIYREDGELWEILERHADENAGDARVDLRPHDSIAVFDPHADAVVSSVGQLDARVALRVGGT